MTQLPTTSSTTPLAAKCCCSTSRDPPVDKPHSLNEQSGQKWKRRRKCHGGEFEAVQRTGEDRSRCLNPLERRASKLEKLLQQWLLLSALLTLFWPFNAVEAIRCYCTDEHCVPYGVCESTVCLVGLLRANNAVIRTCGNQPLGCQRNVDRWSHLCSCDENFCNTFLFLKASTSIDGPRTRSEGSRVDPGEHRVFERVDGPAGEFATFDHPSDDEPAPIKNSNLLTLLLVIVPLSVGGAAVLVVAINYYCHLC